MSRRAYTLAVPARLESSRLARKLLLAETGDPLIAHTLKNLAPLRAEAEILLITDSEEIARAAGDLADRVLLSRREHESGTARIGEHLDVITSEWVVNVQADEPEIAPEAVRELIQRAMARKDVELATLATPFLEEAAWNSPHAVKVLVAADQRAIYFSRAPLPHGGAKDSWRSPGVLHHIGLYAYRRELLARWGVLAPGPLEKAERLEQLRAVENRIPILVVNISSATKGIDTRQDYEEFVKRWSKAAS